MADSGAARQARYKRHKAGDHSECRGCGAAAARPQAVLSVAADADPCADPAGELAALAGRLIAAHKADPGNALLARELRVTLLTLDGSGGGAAAPPEDEVDRIRAAWESGR
jgi:hypothetical protein